MDDMLAVQLARHACHLAQACATACYLSGRFQGSVRLPFVYVLQFQVFVLPSFL